MTKEEIKLTQFSKGGGCGCKIAPSVLQQIVASSNNPAFINLLVGNESSDDAAVFRVNDDMAIISTTDFFMPIVNDPFDFGRIAAANSISDVYAMGGTPLMAIAILGWPVNKLSTDVAQQVLEGGRAVCKEAGIPLAGGHTIDSLEPIFGLAVTGTVHPKHIKKNNEAQPGDLLFLTKPIGVGILSTAMKRGLLKDEHYNVLLKQMTKLNNLGEALGRMQDVHAMTDVTGFGLMGHLVEMAEGSGVSAELDYNAIKTTVDMDEYLAQKTFPGATARNWNSYGNKVQFGPDVNEAEAINLLSDPQTNGGLLIAVKAGAKEDITNLFVQNGLAEFVRPVGKCIEKTGAVVCVR